MSGQMMHILSTRPLDDSLKAAARSKGIDIDDIPFIATEPIQDEMLQAKINALSRLPLTVVFTSMNAVGAVAKWVTSSAPWTIFSIGAATRELAEQYFGKGAIAGTAPSATELAAVILQALGDNEAGSNEAGDNAGGDNAAENADSGNAAAGGIDNGRREVYFFCGDQRRDELPDALRKGGVLLNEVVVYKTIPRPHKLPGSYDGVIFFSPSAVHSFFSVNNVSPGAVLFAIGRTTAGAIRGYAANAIVMAEAPEKEVLVKQVIDHFQTRL